MIARLKGTVAEIGADRLVIDVGGVGYEVSVPARTAEAARLDAPLTLQVYTVLREDALLLYGFATTAEKECFQLLIGVNQVGPKIGLSALSALTVDGLARAINSNDLATLSKIQHVGKKTAERIVLELRDKLVASPLAAAPVARTAPDDPLPLALAQLGYKKSEIDIAIARLAERGFADASPQVRLSESLKIFSSGARA
jgi:Holliday junction DNA helicase RuvA